jgi:hypothetical protein
MNNKKINLINYTNKHRSCYYQSSHATYLNVDNCQPRITHEGLSAYFQWHPLQIIALVGIQC